MVGRAWTLAAVVESPMIMTAQTKVPPSRTLQTPPDLATTASHVGRYELITRLGHGGMASVYLARVRGSAGFERLVAIKVIHPHLASEPHFVEMFLDEAKIAAKIHHPNVVEILDLGEADGVFFMAMEYVEGDTLAALLRRLRQTERRLPFAAAVRAALDAALGLKAAHQLTDDAGQPLRLVHRDVSPHNLLVDMHGRVKVVDFGIMKAAGRPSNTITGQLRGKLAYMSPEQARGEPVDQRTDIFALGVTLWEMCAGERLFAGSNESATLNKVLRCEVPSLLPRAPNLPPGLNLVIERCLAPDRENRYPDADALIEDLKTVAKQLGELDPAALLQEAMERELGGRISYRRQLLRQGGGTTEHGLLGELDQTRAISLDEARRSSSHSRLSVLVTKSWPVWLALPLVAAGVAALSFRGFEANDAPDAVEPVAEVMVGAPANVHVGDAEKPAETRSEQTIQWWFNTVPQGASILIDGQLHDEVTPTSIELPQGSSPKRVVLRKDGFVTHELRLAPVASDNHTFVLEAEPSESSPKKRRSRDGMRKRSRTELERPSGSQTDSAETTEPADPRTLADMPDFSAVKEL